MNQKAWKSDVLLFVAAIIWGTAFVAQRIGMEYVGPFIFNAARFALGALTLIPFLIRVPSSRAPSTPESTAKKRDQTKTVLGCIAIGFILFGGASLQQIGLVYTTAGKAGFITGLYVILVPIFGFFFRHRPGIGVWMGAMSAVVGLYLLSMTGRFTLSSGDSLVLMSAFFWAFHVITIGWLITRMHPVRIAFSQCLICSGLSFAAALVSEEISLQGLREAIVPILYGGILSVGVAYTLQILAQREAKPGHAAIILSLETVFAALGGWLILGEKLSLRGLVGCGFMLAGFIISQQGKKAEDRKILLKERAMKEKLL